MDVNVSINTYINTISTMVYYYTYTHIRMPK